MMRKIQLYRRFFFHSYLLVWLSVFTRIGIVSYVNADYIVQVRTHSYSNPTNWCYACRIDDEDDEYGCCDTFSQTQCSGDQLCENQFYYCLRPFGSVGDECTGGRMSTFNNNDEDIDFTQSVVLGLPNPLPLASTSLRWNGIQLFMEVIDYDSDVPYIPTFSPDDLVDRFLIDISSSTVPVGVETSSSTYSGIFGLASITLSFRVVCADNYTGPDCSECNPGFTGEYCGTNIDECVGANCNENGECVDGVNSFICNCDSGFTGVLCESNIDDCVGVNCNGNGVCADEVNGFSCMCDQGFTGALCEINIDDCVGVDCSGNGECIDGINSFTCQCNSSFTGPLCEFDIDHCVGVDCNGNGQCTQNGTNSFMCECSSGFTGTLCEINIDDCVTVNCSGNGQCEDGVSSFTCFCDSGFQGELCQIKINLEANGVGAGTSETNLNQVGVYVGGGLGGVVLIAVAILVIVLIGLCLYIRRLKASHHHDNVVDNDDTSTVRYNQGSLKNVDPNQSIGFEIITKNLVAYGAASSRSSFQDQDEVIYDEELDEVIYDEELDEVIYDDPEELFYNKRYIPSNLDQPGTRPESDIYDDIL